MGSCSSSGARVERPVEFTKFSISPSTVTLTTLPADVFGPIFSFLPTAKEQVHLRATCTFTVRSFNGAVWNERFISTAGTDATAVTLPCTASQRITTRWFPIDPNTHNASVCGSVMVLGGPNVQSLLEMKTLIVLDAADDAGAPPTSIHDRAFKGLSSLTIVDLSRCTALESLGYLCFARCTSLAAVALPSSLQSIGAYAFHDCTNLSSVDKSNCGELVALGDRCFQNCASLRGPIALPSSLRTIGVQTFLGCSHLTWIDFGRCTALTEIQRSAFARCPMLTRIDLSGCRALRRSYSGGFLGCSAGTCLTLPLASLKEEGSWTTA